VGFSSFLLLSMKATEHSLCFPFPSLSAPPSQWKERIHATLFFFPSFSRCRTDGIDRFLRLLFFFPPLPRSGKPLKQIALPFFPTTRWMFRNLGPPPFFFLPRSSDSDRGNGRRRCSFSPFLSPFGNYVEYRGLRQGLSSIPVLFPRTCVDYTQIRNGSNFPSLFFSITSGTVRTVEAARETSSFFFPPPSFFFLPSFVLPRTRRIKEDTKDRGLLSSFLILSFCRALRKDQDTGGVLLLLFCPFFFLSSCQCREK